MRKLVYLALSLPLLTIFVSACKYAPNENNLKDTVAASEFSPVDTTKNLIKRKKATVIKDSLDLFIIGPSSGKKTVQLIAYPSRKDSTIYGKSKNIKVVGQADIDSLVRVTFHQRKSGDSVISSIIVLPSNLK